MAYYFDRAFGNYLPCDEEELIVAKCSSCGNELAVGDEVVKDGNGDRFCDCDCALNTLDFQLVEQDGYEAILCDGEYFEDLSELQNEYFESEILEMEDNYND